MEYLCTTCCKEKRRDPGLLPAIERYLSARIDFVQQESVRLGKPMLILSGKFGLLAPDERIPWYDLLLTARSVRRMTALVALQMAERGITGFSFYAKPRETPGWLPYYRVMEGACLRRGIPLEVVPVNEAGG